MVAIKISNFERFDYIQNFNYRAFLFYLLSKWTLRWEKVRDREKNSRKGPRYLFQIEKNSRQRSLREYTNVQGTELFVPNREKFEIESSQDRES